MCIRDSSRTFPVRILTVACLWLVSKDFTKVVYYHTLATSSVRKQSIDPVCVSPILCMLKLTRRWAAPVSLSHCNMRHIFKPTHQEEAPMWQAYTLQPEVWKLRDTYFNGHFTIHAWHGGATGSALELWSICSHSAIMLAATPGKLFTHGPRFTKHHKHCYWPRVICGLSLLQRHLSLPIVAHTKHHVSFATRAWNNW